MKHLILVGALALVPLSSFAQNLQYYVSDVHLSCERPDFNLTIQFDGTGDNVTYVFNGVPGAGPVRWSNDQATVDLGGKVAPIFFSALDQLFYVLDVACKEI